MTVVVSLSQWKCHDWSLIMENFPHSGKTYDRILPMGLPELGFFILGVHFDSPSNSVRWMERCLLGTLVGGHSSNLLEGIKKSVLTCLSLVP